MRQTFERVLSAILVLAALSVVAILVHREFYPQPGASLQHQESAFVPDWRSYLPYGRLVGRADAPVTIVEFTDLECPFCKDFNVSLQKVLRTNSEAVNYVFIHLPLKMHPLALPAARAAECGANDGRFGEMVDDLFRGQDSLGVRSWGEFAVEAGIKDTLSFLRCFRRGSFSKIDSGIALAKRLGIHSTPTILLNGWRYGQIPQDTELSRAIADIVRGKKPYPRFPDGP